MTEGIETPKNVLDKTVTDLIDAIAQQGRGFTLGLELKDGKTAISVTEQLQPIDHREHPTDLRRPQINDTASLIQFAHRYGDPTNSMILYSVDCMVCVLDYGIEEGDYETATMPFTPHEDLSEWLVQLGNPMTHRDLVQFMRKHEHHLDTPALIETIRSMSISGQINQDNDMTDDGDSMGVVFKTTKGESLKKFPKEFYIRVPVLDIDSRDDWQAIGCRLQIDMPIKPQDPVTFTVRSHELNNALLERTKMEADLVRDGLNAQDADTEAGSEKRQWLVLGGRHRTDPRTLGVHKKTPSQMVDGR